MNKSPKSSQAPCPPPRLTSYRIRVKSLNGDPTSFFPLLVLWHGMTAGDDDSNPNPKSAYQAHRHARDGNFCHLVGMRTEGAAAQQHPAMRNKTARSRSRFAWMHSIQNSLASAPAAHSLCDNQATGSLKNSRQRWKKKYSWTRAARLRRGEVALASEHSQANIHKNHPLPRISAPLRTMV